MNEIKTGLCYTPQGVDSLVGMGSLDIPYPTVVRDLDGAFDFAGRKRYSLVVVEAGSLDAFALLYHLASAVASEDGPYVSRNGHVRRFDPPFVSVVGVGDIDGLVGRLSRSFEDHFTFFRGRRIGNIVDVGYLG